MNKNLIFILSILLAACRNEYIMNAHLSSVYDKTFEVVSNDTLLDTQTDEFTCRRLAMIYRTINESKDSVHIPIGFQHNSCMSAHLQYRDSLLNIPIYWESCFGKKANGSVSFATGDTISILIRVGISFERSKDKEWLKNISTKELLTKINVSMDLDSSSAIKTNCIIPQIAFYNDTNDISINPPLKIVKR